MIDGLPKIIVSDAVKPGEVFLVSGFGVYPKNQPPQNVVAEDEDGNIIGFLDAAKIIDCGGGQ